MHHVMHYAMQHGVHYGTHYAKHHGLHHATQHGVPTYGMQYGMHPVTLPGPTPRRPASADPWGLGGAPAQGSGDAVGAPAWSPRAAHVEVPATPSCPSATHASAQARRHTLPHATTRHRPTRTLHTHPTAAPPPRLAPGATRVKPRVAPHIMPCLVACFMPRAFVLRSTAARRRLAWDLLSTRSGGIHLTSASARLQAARLVPRTTPPRSSCSHRHSTPNCREAPMLEKRTARETARAPRGRHRVRRSRRTTTASQRRTRMLCRAHRRTHRSPRSARGCEDATLRSVVFFPPYN